MIITEETEVSQQSNHAIQEDDGGAIRSYVKVKLPSGNFKTIIPITTTTSVVTTDGNTLDIDLNTIRGNITANDIAIEELMEDLKRHMEVVDLGNEVESGIFDHVYGELDSMREVLSNLTNNLKTITEKLNKVIEDNNNLSRTVSNLSDKLTSHEDKIV